MFNDPFNDNQDQFSATNTGINDGFGVNDHKDVSDFGSLPDFNPGAPVSQDDLDIFASHVPHIGHDPAFRIQAEINNMSWAAGLVRGFLDFLGF